jgi:polysaccharide chain length determinant protein (PEP-CTERM system associated)
VIPGRVYTPERILAVIWSKRWFLILPTIVGVVGAVVFARRLPDTYQAQTTILVVPQRVPADFVRSTITAPLEGRLPTLAQQILSRTRLERIINDFDLYAEARQLHLMDDVVQKMRGAIHVQNGTRTSSFSLGFTYSDPVVTAKVTDRLASLFIEENLRDREVMADGTSDFLEDQLEQSRQRLIEVEQRLEAYRLKFAGQLPSQLQSNIQMIATLNTQIQQVSDAITRARDRKVTVQGLIAELSVPIEIAAPVALPPGAAGRQAPALTIAQQLDAARQEFQGIEARLTPEHPDYGRAQRKLAELEKKVAAEKAEAAKDPTHAPPALSAAEVTRRNRVAELRAELATLDGQMAQQALHEQKLRDDLASYQARVEATPSRESEMTELTRDYATLQESYRQLLIKRQDAQIAANLEKQQVGEQFKVLDPAKVPERAASPNRPLIVLGGAALGLLLGVALGGLLEVRDTTVRSENEVERALELPLLAAVPWLILPSEQRAKRRRRQLSAVAAALLVIAATSFMVWTRLNGQ